MLGSASGMLGSASDIRILRKLGLRGLVGKDFNRVYFGILGILQTLGVWEASANSLTHQMTCQRCLGAFLKWM